MASPTSSLAASASLARGKERRRAVRYAIGREACWTVRIFVGQEELVAGVHDISARGLGLVLPRRLDRGLLFTAELTNTLSLVLSARAVRVVHVTVAPTGGYLIGCQFETPLTPELLGTLLA